MCFWLAAEEGSLPCGSSLRAQCVCLVAGVVLSAATAGCRAERVATAPDPASPYLGRWTGTVVSSIGEGAIIVDLDMHAGTNPLTLLSGSYSRRFEDATFAAQGGVTGNTSPDGAYFVLTFDRGPVPCPGEPSGIAERALVALLSPRQNQLHGNYIVGGCPGGSMELTKR